jgi:hypothetical protein
LVQRITCSVVSIGQRGWSCVFIVLTNLYYKAEFQPFLIGALFVFSVGLRAERVFFFLTR